MHQTLKAAWPLFFGLAMLMIGNGLQGTLLGVRANIEGFSTLTIGMIMSLYYVGYLSGSFFVPKLIISVGHIRVFAALASLASTTVLFHGIFEQPAIWAIVRVFTGFSYAGLFIVMESWLNQSATNNNRGKIMALYLIVLYAGMTLGQFLLNVADPADIELFVMTSVLVSLALLPISLSSRPAPEFTEPERVSIKTLYRVSPLGIAGVMISGLASSALFAIGPVYAAEIGLSVSQLSTFMAAFIFGGVLLQAPIGWLSDRFDRRIVLIGVTGASALLCFLAYPISLHSTGGLIALMPLIGGTALSIYALSLSHTNDHLLPGQIIATSATLILLNGAISTIGPFMATGAMSAFGAYSFFLYIGMVYLALTLFGLYRTRRRAAVPLDEQGDHLMLQERNSPIIMQIAEDSAETMKQMRDEEEDKE